MPFVIPSALLTIANPVPLAAAPKALETPFEIATEVNSNFKLVDIVEIANFPAINPTRIPTNSSACSPSKKPLNAPFISSQPLFNIVEVTSPHLIPPRNSPIFCPTVSHSTSFITSTKAVLKSVAKVLTSISANAPNNVFEASLSFSHISLSFTIVENVVIAPLKPVLIVSASPFQSTISIHFLIAPLNFFPIFSALLPPKIVVIAPSKK